MRFRQIRSFVCSDVYLLAAGIETCMGFRPPVITHIFNVWDVNYIWGGHLSPFYLIESREWVQYVNTNAHYLVK